MGGAFFEKVEKEGSRGHVAPKKLQTEVVGRPFLVWEDKLDHSDTYLERRKKNHGGKKNPRLTSFLIGKKKGGRRANVGGVGGYLPEEIVLCKLV